MEPAPTPLKRMHYAQLDQHVQEIRLMILDHGKASADIKCRLIHTTLGRHPAYKALSYSWDDVKVLCPIDVDGCFFGIGPNLKAALQSIRHPNEPTYLWVDAICINQKDIAERNYQVTIMHEIYQWADQVIVWLGKRSFDSDYAMDVLEDENIGKWMDLFPPTEKDSTVVTYTAIAMATLKALGHFFSRSWWSRVWVMQEVVWAPDVIVMCGSREMSWVPLIRSSVLIRQAIAGNSSNVTLATMAALGGCSSVLDMTDVML